MCINLERRSAHSCACRPKGIVPLDGGASKFAGLKMKTQVGRWTMATSTTAMTTTTATCTEITASNRSLADRHVVVMGFDADYRLLVVDCTCLSVASPDKEMLNHECIEMALRLSTYYVGGMGTFQFETEMWWIRTFFISKNDLKSTVCCESMSNIAEIDSE